MAVVMILVLLVLQFLCGAGILRHAGIRLPAVLFVAVALLSGLAIASLVPFVLQLCFIPITFFTVFPVLVVVSVLLNLKYGVLLAELRQIAKTQLAIRVSEIPFLLVIFFLVMVSIWRCFYLPPTPRDLTSGPEAIAEYTVAEKTMANSV
ncbi:MAG TPA: hypothetical protein VFZ78_00330, partial [Flavisolibacter sp.]